jgi:hypothetical protein
MTQRFGLTLILASLVAFVGTISNTELKNGLLLYFFACSLFLLGAVLYILFEDDDE